MHHRHGPFPLLAAVLPAAVVLAACGSRSGLDAPPADRQLAASPPQPEPLLPTEAPPPAPASRGCVDLTRSYDSEPASVMLLIDQSASMDQGGFGRGTRWDVLRQAIVDPDNGLLAWLDQSSRVGLMLYTSFDGYASPLGCPVLTSVQASFGSVDEVRRLYLASRPAPAGDTPTGEGIDAAAGALSALDSSAPKYILLITDGAPDTCAQPDPQLGLPQAIDAAQRAFNQGIRVYTVGVAEEINGSDLQALANAGAGKDPALVYGNDPGAEPALFARTDPQQLADQLKGIIGDVRTCTIGLQTDVGAARTLDGRLVLDGQPLANDARNGWTFLDDRTLLVHGSACEKILGDGQRLEVHFPCVTDLAPLR